MANQKITEFVTLMFSWSKVHNLTAWKDPQVTIEHLNASGIAISPHLRNPIVDVGTGAGIPGLVLAILNPNMHFTLIDSRHKKIAFVRHACQQLKIDNVTTIISRAEKITTQKHLHHYRTLVCRAFGKVEYIINTAKHLLAPHARLLLERGQNESPIQLPYPFDNNYYLPLPYPARGKLFVIQT